MRKILIETLCELARQDDRIVLLTGDLGYTVVEPFQEAFPERFYNLGVAEQNMIGVATGLAEAGYIPFVYSIVTFATLRAYEFIRNGPVWHNLPVRILGIGGGLEYGTLGLTHYGLDDIGVMRLQPAMKILAPADNLQLKTMLKKTWNLPGPIYYRISKYDARVVGLRGRFGLGRLQLIRHSPKAKILILTTGAITKEVMVAIDCSVGIISSINPAPVRQLKQLLSKFELVMTIEAHYAISGIGSLVAEVIGDYNLPCRLIRWGVKTTNQFIGSEAYLHKMYKISSAKIYDQLKTYSAKN
jgi:transketolase